MSIEKIILSNLIYNEEYSRKVIPFLSKEYFSNLPEKIIYETIDKYFKTYNSCPTIESLFIDVSNTSISEDTYKESKNIINELSKDDTSIDWLVDNTEKFCQEKAIYNGIMKSIHILDDKTGKESKNAIPQILTDALAVSFDTSIGHSYTEDVEKRFEFYHTKEIRKPFDLEYFNKITNGGLPRKTLNIALAGTGVGKSLFMCHCAAADLVLGLNVLYITLEMAEERIAERIDANLLDIPMDELELIPKDLYDKKFNRIKSKTIGKLIIKEYPTACAGSANFRHLINELKIKKNFKPDIIYIDYLNICTSSRIKMNNQVNSYTFIKAIAEELRGLAVEFNVPIVSATQTTRGGYASSDVGLEDTSESFGLPATADFMFALIKTDELEDQNMILVKQLKNRYNDKHTAKRFLIGVDHSKMRLYDVETKAQEGLLEGPKKSNSYVGDKPIFDTSGFGGEDLERSKPKSKFDKSKFKDFL